MKALAVGPDGALWVGLTLSVESDSAGGRLGMGMGGLARLHDGAWEVFTEANSALPSNFVEAVAVGPDGALWVGSFSGLVRLQDAVWEVFRAASSDLPNDSVWALAVDLGGALWVGTSGGLARLHEGAWEVFTEADSDLPSDHVGALAVGTDGALWIGREQVVTSTDPLRLSDGCLARLHEGDWKVFTAAEIGLPSENLKGQPVWPGLSVETLAVGPDGALWVGALAGLARLQDGTWEVFSAANSDLPNDSVQALAVERDGVLWVGTQSGLARLHEGAWEVFTKADSNLPHDLVNALAVDADGAIWVGTLRGLGRLHQGTWGFTAAASDLPNDFVLAMAVDPEGALWAGTEGGGLARTMYSRIPHPKLVPVLPPDVIAQAENTFAV